MTNKKMWMIGVTKLAGLSLLVVLTACSAVDRAIDTKNGINYSNNKTVKVIEAPEGITPPEFDTTFTLPENASVSSKQQSDIDLTPPDLTK